MNNIHTQIELWMVAALTDSLSATERNAFDAHLQSCARCRQLFADQQTVSTLLEQAFAPDQPDDEFEERMVEQYRQNVAKKKLFTLPDLGRARETWLAFCHFPAVRFAAAAIIVALLVVLGGVLSGEVNLISLKIATNESSRGYPQVFYAPETQGDPDFLGTHDDVIKTPPDNSKGVWVWNNFENSAAPRQSLLAGLFSNESGFTGFNTLQIPSGTTNLNGNVIHATGGALNVHLAGSGTTSPLFSNRVLVGSGTMEFGNATVETVGFQNNVSPNLFEVAGANQITNFGTIISHSVNGTITGTSQVMNFGYASNDKGRFIVRGDGTIALPTNFLGGNAFVASNNLTGGLRDLSTVSIGAIDSYYGGIGYGDAREKGGRLVNEGGQGLTVDGSSGKASTLRMARLFTESGASVTSELATVQKAEHPGGWRYEPESIVGKLRDGETAGKRETDYVLWSGGPRRPADFGNDDMKTWGDDSKQQLDAAEKRMQEVRTQTEGQLTERETFERLGPTKELDERTAAFEIAPVVPARASELGFKLKGRGTLDVNGLIVVGSRAGGLFTNTGRIVAEGGEISVITKEFLNVGFISGALTNQGLVGVYGSGSLTVTGLLTNQGTLALQAPVKSPVPTADQPINPVGDTIIVTGSITNRTAGGGTFTTGVPEVKPPAQLPQNPPPNQLAQQPPPRPQPRQQPAQKAAPPAPQPPPVGVTEVRKLIRSAQMEFEVSSYDETLLRVQEIVGEERGLLVTSNSSRLPNGKVRGDVVIKVLPDFLERLVWKLRGIGELKKQTLGSQDVTKQYFDTEARKRNLEAMEKRLLEMLARVQGKVPELLEVEKEIARVRAEIEGLQGELKYVDTLVAYATINLTLYEKDLNQPAAFLLKEKANLSIFSPDVEKTLNDAKRSAETAKAQVLHSKLDRETSGRVTGTFSVLVAPEAADLLLESFRHLGRVSSLNRTSERVAIGGQGGSDTAKVEKDKVEINLVIVHDDESRRRVRLVVVTKAVEESLEKAKAAAAKHSAEVLLSNFTRPSAGESAAQFTVRVPAKAYDAMLGEFKAFGRVAEFNVELKENNTESKENTAPVLVAMVLASSEPPLQITNLAVQRQGVETVLDKLKADAVKLGGEIRASNFVRSPDGQELANLAFRIPLKDNGALVEMLKMYGDVKSLSVERQDRVQEGKPDENAPAEVRLQFFSHQAPMQITQLAVERKDVESVLAALKEQAVKLGAEIRASNFVRYPNGQELANLAFRLPMKQNQQLLDLLKSLGDIKGYTVERQDRLTESKVDENAPAEIRLQLGSRPPIIEEDSGFMVTMKQTVGQGFGWFMWGIKMIGVALAFIAPWLAAFAVLWWGFKKLRRKKAVAKA